MCVYVCMCVCMYAYLCMYVYIYDCVYVCISNMYENVEAFAQITRRGGLRWFSIQYIQGPPKCYLERYNGVEIVSIRLEYLKPDYCEQGNDYNRQMNVRFENAWFPWVSLV